MNDNSYEQLVEGMAENLIRACELAAETNPGIDPARLAATVSAFVLLSVAASTDRDSALITVRKADGGWSTHIHMDYLDADPDHLAKDFQFPNPHDNEREEYHD